MWRRSGHPHALNELLARGAFEQGVSHPVDAFGAGEFPEKPGHSSGRLFAKLPFDLPAKNQGLTLLAPLLGPLVGSPAQFPWRTPLWTNSSMPCWNLSTTSAMVFAPPFISLSG